ncbi:AAA domain family protein, partial [Vibrio parahaemolyticus V-223/04]
CFSMKLRVCRFQCK